MSLLRNLLGAFVPVREQRRSDTQANPLNAANAEFVHDVNGDESALIMLGATGLNATVEFTGSVDGVNFYLIPVLPYLATGGAIPVLSRPMVQDVFGTVTAIRAYSVMTAGLRKIRVRLSAHSAGSAAITINSDPNAAIHPNHKMPPTTDFVTTTAAVGVAVTASLPAVAGFRHYIDFIQVRRNATALLTAAAVPVNVTTTNLPGLPILSFGADAAAQGTDKDDRLDFGAIGLAATAIGSPTTVVCPATPNVIWRVNVAYRLGL